MFEYMVVMALISTAAVLLPRRTPHPVLWGAAFVILVLFVGLRHKVGMDWNNYLLMIVKASEGSLSESFAVAEPAYAALLWLADWAEAGIYGANLVGAIVLLLGIFRFSYRTPLPWVSLVTAMPILVVVVGMSANRQAMAIGVLLWLTAGWASYTLPRRLMLILVASMLHFSAIFFLMFVALGLQMKAVYKLVLAVIMVGAMLAFLQFTGGGEYYDQLYVSGQSEETYSPGAIMHVLLNGIPAALVLSRRPMRELLFPTSLQVQMAWVALALIPLALVFSAAAGRMTLYLFPVSMYAFAALPSAFRSATQRAVIRTVVSTLMLAILWFWLAYANSSLAHIPYENALWMSTRELHL